jgi:hypothetical protein
MSRRQRIDTLLLLIVRRAERDTRVGSHPRSQAPDALTAREETHPSQARSPQPS